MSKATTKRKPSSTMSTLTKRVLTSPLPSDRAEVKQKVSNDDAIIPSQASISATHNAIKLVDGLSIAAVPVSASPAIRRAIRKQNADDLKLAKAVLTEAMNVLGIAGLSSASEDQKAALRRLLTEKLDRQIIARLGKSKLTKTQVVALTKKLEAKTFGKVEINAAVKATKKPSAKAG